MCFIFVTLASHFFIIFLNLMSVSHTKVFSFSNPPLQIIYLNQKKKLRFNNTCFISVPLRYQIFKKCIIF